MSPSLRERSSSATAASMTLATDPSPFRKLTDAVYSSVRAGGGVSSRTFSFPEEQPVKRSPAISRIEIREFDRCVHSLSLCVFCFIYDSLYILIFFIIHVLVFISFL